ncbi:MAG: hypothetical protein OXL34_04035 [Gemmatimonadota bacterium]|nr:hypothetical protein [Gemmatimonadota bacterium]
MLGCIGLVGRGTGGVVRVILGKVVLQLQVREWVVERSPPRQPRATMVRASRHPTMEE